jgi:hypothetical protein
MEQRWSRGEAVVQQFRGPVLWMWMKRSRHTRPSGWRMSGDLVLKLYLYDTGLAGVKVPTIFRAKTRVVVGDFWF